MADLHLVTCIFLMLIFDLGVVKVRRDDLFLLDLSQLISLFIFLFFSHKGLFKELDVNFSIFWE